MEKVLRFPHIFFFRVLHNDRQIHHIFNIYSFALRKYALGKLIVSFVQENSCYIRFNVAGRVVFIFIIVAASVFIQFH